MSFNMQTKKIPIKLGKEPLVDVVCGVNLVCNQSIEAILPGVLLKALEGKKLKFEPTPIGALPQAVRASNPALQNAPLMRITVDEQFVALVGEKSLGVGCQMPYAGWRDFKKMIETAFNSLRGIELVRGIERHYVKYVDLLPEDARSSALQRFNIDISVAGRKLNNEVTTLQSEISDGKYMHTVVIASQATVTRPNLPTLTGALINVETRCSDEVSIDSFMQRMPELLDDIHAANKQFFFSLLSDSGLAELEPHYA